MYFYVFLNFLCILIYLISKVKSIFLYSKTTKLKFTKKQDDIAEKVYNKYLKSKKFKE